jgi:hypothetical protein
LERDFASKQNLKLPPILSNLSILLSNWLHLETSVLSRKLMMKVGMIEKKIGLRRKEGLARYLSCLSYNHIHLSVSEHILFDAHVPALKPGSTETRSREREEKMGIFRRLHTKNHRKPTLFRKVSYQKPKIGTLVTTEFGGGRYQSSIGICRGPQRTYRKKRKKKEKSLSH